MVNHTADFGAGAGADHEGGVLLACHRRVRGHDDLPVLAQRRGRRAARRLVHHGAADDGRANRRQRGVVALPCVIGCARGGHRGRRRIARLCRVGVHAHQEREDGAGADRRAGHHHLRGRLLQLPHRGRGHAARHRPLQHQPREAGVDHRLHRGAHLHHRARVVVGRGRGRLSGRGRLHDVRAVHPLQLLRAAHHRVRLLHVRDQARLRPHARCRGRSAAACRAAASHSAEG